MKQFSNFVTPSLIFIFSFLILARFKIDPDLGWHLAYGREFLENGQIVRGDVFSWTMPGYVWGNSYFFYQIAASFLFLKFGHITTSFIFALLNSFGVMILVLGQRLNLWKVLAILLGAIIVTVNLSVRPHSLSFVMFAVLLVLFEKGFFKKFSHVLFWFLFFALWANLHRGFIIGILTLAGYLFLAFLGWKKKEKRFLKIGLLCVAAAFLGGLVTPFPLGPIKSGIFFDLTSPGNLLNIAEWQPLVVYFPINLLFALSGIIFIYVFLKNIKTANPIWFILAALFFTLPFLATNFVFYWGAIFIFITGRYFDFKLELGRSFATRLPIILSTIALVATIFLTFFENVLKSRDLEKRLVLDKYPVAAAQFLQKENLREGLFNEYSWGGFIDWQYPAIKVFIDGRMAGWRMADGSSILSDYLAIRKGDCTIAQKYQIKVLLLKNDSKVDCFSDFVIIYEDSVAKIYTKTI